MGTLLAVCIPAGRPGAEDPYVRAAFETARTCEEAMSRHQPDSDLSRLNRVAGQPDGVVSPELAAALRLARELAACTDGAFDPTVAPVLELWRRAAHLGARPGRRRLRAALDHVGWPAMKIAGTRVALARRGMAVDLDAFAKGCALDRISMRLRNDGCGAALLNFGESSLLAIGRPPASQWTVALRHPLGGFAGEFPLKDRACSTSATFGRPLRVGGARVSPVVDPSTGQPLRSVAQVTVLARSAAVAEALSTAILVAGRSVMEDTARRLDVDACWIDPAGTHTTPWFPLRRLA
jgi:thiamine biosynthesis lipoprotein